MITSTLIVPDETLSDDSRDFYRLNKILGDIVSFVVASCQYVEVLEDNNPTDNVSRKIVLKVFNSPHYIKLNTGSYVAGYTTYKRIYISLLRLDGVTDWESTYDFRTNSSGFRLYVIYSPKVFCFYDSKTSLKMVYARLTDGSFSSIIHNSNDFYAALESNDTQYTFKCNERSFGYATDNNKILLIPAKIRTLDTGKILSSVTFDDCLYSIDNTAIGGISNGDILQDEGGRYYMVLGYSTTFYLLGL